MSIESASEAHGKPVAGTTCMSCWEDIDESIYVEYRYLLANKQKSSWKPSGYCQMCIEHIKATQWNTYTTNLANTKCKAEQRRLLERGPPINIRDSTALPTPGGYVETNLDSTVQNEGSTGTADAAAANVETKEKAEETSCEICDLWYASDGSKLQSAKLTDSKIGADREQYWAEQRMFYIKDESDKS